MDFLRVAQFHLPTLKHLQLRSGALWRRTLRSGSTASKGMARQATSPPSAPVGIDVFNSSIIIQIMEYYGSIMDLLWIN